MAYGLVTHPGVRGTLIRRQHPQPHGREVLPGPATCSPLWGQWLIVPLAAFVLNRPTAPLAALVKSWVTKG